MFGKNFMYEHSPKHLNIYGRGRGEGLAFGLTFYNSFYGCSYMHFLPNACSLNDSLTCSYRFLSLFSHVAEDSYNLFHLFFLFEIGQ